MATVKIFGREPAALVGVVEAALVLLLSFGLFNLTQETVGLILAAVTSALGIYLAYVTNDTLLGAVVGFTKAVLALAVVYGLPLTIEQTGALIAVVTVVVGFWQRGQTSPLERPTFKRERVQV